MKNNMIKFLCAFGIFTTILAAEPSYYIGVSSGSGSGEMNYEYEDSFGTTYTGTGTIDSTSTQSISIGKINGKIRYEGYLANIDLDGAAVSAVGGKYCLCRRFVWTVRH
jgi:hypothetical protein